MNFLEYSENTNTSGSKFVLSCKEISENSSTTKDWLENISALSIIPEHKSTGMSHKKILEAILEKKSKVVVKVADTQEDIEVEWRVYECLHKSKIPGILRYICFFRCDDNLLKYSEKQPMMCNGVGNNLQVLVMEYINNKSFKNFDWSSVSENTFRSCVKQCILTLFDGFQKCGFVHGDFHLDNILLHRTSRASIAYEHNIIPVYGLQIKIMDFEISKLGNNNPCELFKDLRTFFGKLYNLADYIYVDDVIRSINQKLIIWIENDVRDISVVSEIISMCDEIRYVESPKGGCISYTRKTRVDIGKKKCTN